MRRRDFIAVLGAAAGPVTVLAQTSGAVHRVGLLGAGPPPGDASPMVKGLGAGFARRGYAVGRDLVFERRAAAHRLPAIYEFDFLVRDGGLMSYGPDMAALYDRATGLAARILKGANPADLPLEEPTRFRFAINLKTAQAIGLTVPAMVLAQANEIIQ